METRRPFNYEITIRPVAGGMIVFAGCFTKVYTNEISLLKDLEEYLNNPEKVEKSIIGPMTGQSAPAASEAAQMAINGLRRA